ncbi:hypothetical protein Strvi_2332 [Streptomyces violaceusniger Tu 4113]|uniref:Uncharacterized protein n=1 Tax=Streptomyces violaceusniger (strain Tu 4113) TaxID=653045 RepID=G2NYI9_STRV4|nr:hypothetical protein Strvi_2332 [Streptomyces violaceusniger Tu 4113]
MPRLRVAGGPAHRLLRLGGVRRILQPAAGCSPRRPFPNRGSAPDPGAQGAASLGMRQTRAGCFPPRPYDAASASPFASRARAVSRDIARKYFFR